MMRDRGTVLINALVVVLAIAAVSTALLARSEGARLRAQHAQGAEQLDLYLDAGERLIPQLLRQVRADGIATPDQDWSRAQSFPIDRARVSATITDLQGRLNVNWLTRDDAFVEQMFQQVFAEAGLPVSLVGVLKDYVSDQGPAAAAYLALQPPVHPRGGRLFAIEDLLAIDGLRADDFARLQDLVAALPLDSKLNLNTAPTMIVKAALAGLPSELIAELQQRDTPLESISEIRRRAQEILETEDLPELNLDRLTVTSFWFRATLSATLDGADQRRAVVYAIDPTETNLVRRVHRWTVYD